MTKTIRVENACSSDYNVVVESWLRGVNGEPDKMVCKFPLNNPTALLTETIWDTKYLVVRERYKDEPIFYGVVNNG
jgi:hypothetical protein